MVNRKFLLEKYRAEEEAAQKKSRKKKLEALKKRIEEDEADREEILSGTKKSPPRREGRHTQLNVRLTQDLLERFQEKCTKDGSSQSEVVRDLINEWLGQ